MTGEHARIARTAARLEGAHDDLGHTVGIEVRTARDVAAEAIAGPVTMEGMLIVQNAEMLAGITLIQLVREGAPVVYGGQSTSAAMRYGTLSIGAPEIAINTAATAQLGRFYNLPSRSGGATPAA